MKSLIRKELSSIIKVNTQSSSESRLNIKTEKSNIFTSNEKLDARNIGHYLNKNLSNSYITIYTKCIESRDLCLSTIQ